MRERRRAPRRSRREHRRYGNAVRQRRPASVVLPVCDASVLPPKAGLEVLAAADRVTSGDTSAAPSITVVAIRRYRFDHLPSGGLLNIRGRVASGLRDNVRADLERLRRDSEAAWLALPASARR